MIDEASLSSELRWNPRCLVIELQRRGIDVVPFDRTSQVLVATLGGHIEYLVETDSSALPFPTVFIANHKQLAKLAMMQAGVPVPKGRRFDVKQENDAVGYGIALGYPVVMKPCTAASGVEVHLGLMSVAELEEAFESIVRGVGPGAEILVEKQVVGDEHRVFIARDGRYAVVHRDPAHVVGDGRQTIAELAKAESLRRTTPRSTCIGPIKLDKTAGRHLARAGLSFESVPKEGEKVYLRANSNVAGGATCDDVTDRVHPSVLEICMRAIEAVPHLLYGGVDFMTTDISVDQAKTIHHVVELNTNPSLGIHIAPGRGRGRNVAAVVADYVFPETRVGSADRRIRKIEAG